MSESVFGEAFADDPSLKREDMYLQSNVASAKASMISQRSIF